jgi:tetratricopeptide (TPR) repeat protein
MMNVCLLALLLCTGSAADVPIADIKKSHQVGQEAHRLAEGGRKEEAIQMYQQAIQIAPSEAGHHFNLGLTFNELYAKYYMGAGHGKVDPSVMLHRAIYEYEMAISLLDPADERRFGVHKNVALLYSVKKDTASQLRHFKAAAALRPTDAELLFNFGNALYNERTPERLSEASNAYRSALALQPSNSKTAASLGVMLLLLHGEKCAAAGTKQQCGAEAATDEADALMSRCVKSCDAETQLFAGLAVEQASESWSEALLKSALADARSVGSTASTGFYTLGRMYRRSGRMEEERSLYEAAVAAGIWRNVRQRPGFLHSGIRVERSEAWPDWKKLAEEEESSGGKSGGEVVGGPDGGMSDAKKREKAEKKAARKRRKKERREKEAQEAKEAKEGGQKGEQQLKVEESKKREEKRKRKERKRQMQADLDTRMGWRVVAQAVAILEAAAAGVQAEARPLISPAASEPGSPSVATSAVQSASPLVLSPEHDGEQLNEGTGWQQWVFVKEGRPAPLVTSGNGTTHFPRLMAMLSELAALPYGPMGQLPKGSVEMSVLLPQTRIKSHCGPSNHRLRMHLGIEIPPESAIEVGGRRERWEEGKVLVFDDSYEHQVWNNATSPRVVLIVDFWHPELTGNMRQQVRQSFARQG